MDKQKQGAGGGGGDSGGGGRVKVYLHSVSNDEATLLADNGNTCPLQEVKKQSRASEVQFDPNPSPATGMKIIIIRGTPKAIGKAVSLISQKTGSKQTISEQAQTFWLQWVQDAFPDLDSRAYFLPPVYFNCVPMTKETIAGQDVLVLNSEHGQSCKSDQLTPNEGDSEQKLPRDASQSTEPTPPDHEYQDTQPTLLGQTIQCIQPTSAEQPCNSNQTTPPGHFSQVNQLTPDDKAGYSNRMAPSKHAGHLPSPEQTGNYIQAAPRRQAGQCIQLTAPGQVGHYNETSHRQNGQLIQTPPVQFGQYIQAAQQPKQTGQYNQLTQPGHTGKHIQAAPLVHTSQYKQTAPNVQAGQYLQTTPTGSTGHSPPGQDGQGIQSYPPGQTGQYSQTTTSGRSIHDIQQTPCGLTVQYPPPFIGQGQYIRLPAAQAGQYIETTPPGQAGQYMYPTLVGEAYQYSQTTPLRQAGQYLQTTPPGQAGQYIYRTPLRESYQHSQTTQSGLASHYMQTTPPRQADQHILSPHGMTGEYIHTPPELTGQYTVTPLGLTNQCIQTSPEPTGQYTQTKAHAQAGQCIIPTPHEQASQHIELEAASSDVKPSVPQPPKVQESDIRDDAAKQRVLVCLQELSERNKEVLVGMSQLHFGQYLGEPVYAAAAAQLPIAQNIPKTSSKTPQGSYDVLLIHRHYGFVVCQVKAFGDLTKKLTMSQQDIDNNIRKKLKDAISQLDKAEAMLSHLVSDIAPGLRITKTIAFPNLTAGQVEQAISDDTHLTQDLCRCLEAPDPAAIAGLCLCSDQLSDPETPCDVSSHVLGELGHWWQRRVAGAGHDSHMTDVVYKKLVARFCGPATTVTVPCISPPRLVVKTLGQAVSHTGDCYTAVITLFPQQADLLHKAPPRLFVAGPPGTGKTVVLLMMGIEWLRCGHPVYIVSTWKGGRAACIMLYHLLLQTIKKQFTPDLLPSQLHILHVDLDGNENVEKAIDDLSQAASGGLLHVLIDEMGHEDTPGSGAPNMKHTLTFCEKLLTRVPGLHLWAASCYHKNSPPGWQVEYLTRPLRSPPAVVREIKKDTTITKGISIKKYSERGVADHTDGPPVTRLYHRGQGHSGYWPIDCVTCCGEVVSFLHSLRVGVTENNVLTTSNTVTSTTSGSTSPCLQWRDILVLYATRLGFYYSTSTIERVLREAGIPVRVMKDEDIEDVATARSDVVWVGSGNDVRGLERKVVVCFLSEYESTFYRSNYDVMSSTLSAGYRSINDVLSAGYRSACFHSISRCTSQLVIVSSH